MCQQATCVLECLPIAVSTGRHFIADRLHEWGAQTSDVGYPRVNDVLLAASELLSNAVRACQGEDEIRLELECHRDEIRVSVTDPRPDAPAVVIATGPWAEGGRGLALVDAVTREWGQKVEGGHKSVWFAVPVPSGSSMATGCRRP
jgi:anti-sigma regulatory factor (Ser/Thr protein kinase)